MGAKQNDSCIIPGRIRSDVGKIHVQCDKDTVFPLTRFCNSLIDFSIEGFVEYRMNVVFILL